jgi:hypothetical protein
MRCDKSFHNRLLLFQSMLELALLSMHRQLSREIQVGRQAQLHVWAAQQ